MSRRLPVITWSHWQLPAVMSYGIGSPLCSTYNQATASVIYHDYPSPPIDNLDGSFGLGLTNTEAIDGMEATQKQSNWVYAKGLEPKYTIKVIGP